MSATWDKFHGAALLLAGAGPVKQRLADAFRTHLVDLDVKDLPRELSRGIPIAFGVAHRWARRRRIERDRHDGPQTLRGAGSGVCGAVYRDVRPARTVASTSSTRTGAARHQLVAGVIRLNRA